MSIRVGVYEELLNLCRDLVTKLGILMLNHLPQVHDSSRKPLVNIGHFIQLNAFDKFTLLFK